jgi:hypothetical protein
MFGKKDDAGAGDAGAVVSGSGISNEAAITRYPADEQPASDEVKTLKSAVVHATFPGTDIVATLATDTTVTELATHAGGVLIVFEQAGTKKMGWVDAAVVPAIATVEDASVVKPTNTVVVRHDAGVKVVDAGAAKVVDAGAPKPAVVVDAGAPKPAGSTKQILKDAVAGKCEAGYYMYPAGENKCRLVCTADAECGGSKCRDLNGHKFCYR